MVKPNLSRLSIQLSYRHLVLIVAALLSACSTTEEIPFDYGYPAPPPEERPDEPLVTPIAAREPVVVKIRPDTPDTYIVKRGDTLWDISQLFLKDAWLWPEVWYFNPQIDNPHLIYPGDIIQLIYIDGKPQLRLARPGEPVTTTRRAPPIPSDLKTIKLRPKVRREDISAAIPTIPLSAIQPFLLHPRVISREEIDAAPYIVGSLDDHLINGPGSTVYVRGLTPENGSSFNIFRPTRPLRDPKNPDEIIGYETLLVSEAKLLKTGDPASLMITDSKRETLNGDRILPLAENLISYNFLPRAPSSPVEGEIIALVDAISQSARNQIVIINLGDNDGIESGHVLAIDQAGSLMRDRFSKKNNDKVRAPDIRAGLLMVFSTFDRISYALIVDSTRAVHISDKVRNPIESVE